MFFLILAYLKEGTLAGVNIENDTTYSAPFKYPYEQSSNESVQPPPPPPLMPAPSLRHNFSVIEVKQINSDSIKSEVFSPPPPPPFFNLKNK